MPIPKTDSIKDWGITLPTYTLKGKGWTTSSHFMVRRTWDILYRAYQNAGSKGGNWNILQARLQRLAEFKGDVL